MVAVKHLEEHDPASDFQPGHLLGDRYRVEKLIAAGGMGFVYMATDLEQQQLVALKVMRSSLQRDPTAIERFRREVRTIKRLMHPNTIELIDYGVTEDGFMFLIMEWLHGKDLREIMRIKKRLSPITVTRIGIQVAWSLSEAHAKGIIHRDLKPENIFIMHNPGPHLRIKVVDFGLAKAVEGPDSLEQITRGGVVCGTPEYMSPEQAKGERLDGRSDIYALGCVMFALLQGDAPFRGKKALDVAMRHISDPFPPFSVQVPAMLRQIIDKCVTKNRDHRFNNVNELADALENFLDPIEIKRRDANDTWSVRRSVAPTAANAALAGSANSPLSRRSAESLRAERTGVTPVSTRMRISKNPSPSIKLKQSLLLSSRSLSEVSSAQRQKRAPGFFKRMFKHT